MAKCVVGCLVQGETESGREVRWDYAGSTYMISVVRLAQKMKENEREKVPILNSRKIRIYFVPAFPRT